MTDLLFWTATILSVAKAADDLVPVWAVREPFEWVGELAATIVGVTVAAVVGVALSTV